MKQKTSHQVKAKKGKNQKEKSNTKQPLSWMAQELLARNWVGPSQNGQET
jgi:hypothetical protein